MKRVLFLLMFFIASVSLAFSQQQITVTGIVKDSAGNPVTGGHVDLYYYSSTFRITVGVVNGSYRAVIPNPPNRDTLVAQFQGCNNFFSVKKAVTPQTNSVTMPELVINCKPDIIATVEGQVVDSIGLPVPHVQVSTFAYHDLQADMTDGMGRFHFDITMPSLSDSLLTLRVLDRCGHYKYSHVTFHYPDTTNVTIHVRCGIQPRLIINGNVIDQRGRYLQDVVVWAKRGSDTTKYMGVVSDSGHFVLEVPVPAANTKINLWIDQVDTTGSTSQATDTITFDGSDYIYTSTLSLSVGEPVKLLHINGMAYDKNGSGVPGVRAKAWTKSIPGKKAVSITDKYGGFDLTLIPATVPSDSIFIELIDTCGNVYKKDTLLHFANNNYLSLDFNNVKCKGRPPIIQISGIIKDRRGHPAPGLTVHIMEVEQGNHPYKPEVVGDDENSSITNDYGYYKIVFPAPSMHPLNYVVFVQDKCYNNYAQGVTFDYPHLEYKHIDFTVKCSKKDMYRWEGFVKNGQGKPLAGVKIRGSLLSDSMARIVTVTNLRGHYLIKAGAAMDSLILVKVMDGCGNVLYDTIPFSTDQYRYVRNYTMQCAGQVPDTVVNFIGFITDTLGKAVRNQVVMVSLIDSVERDSVILYTISDAKGFYSVSLPMPEKEVSIYERVQDDCGNVYEVRDSFDFSKYFIRKDYQIACPPRIKEISPRLDVGYEPDWQNFNTFNFYAHVKNIPDSLIRVYVWRLAFDTIATYVPRVTYTFPSMDTCFKVGVKVITKDGEEVKSPLLKVCVQDPFAEFNDKCYADFMVSRTDLAQNIFSFIPFIQARPGYLAYEAKWDFGDGSTLTLVPPDTLDNPVTHQYTSKGLYNVTYTVTFQDTSNNTCVARWSDPVWVGHDVWYPDSCAAVFYVVLDSSNFKKVHFEDISYPGDSAQIDYYYWDFGDGNIDYAPSPTHVFDTSGLYNVTMKIITSKGCSDVRDVVVKIQQGLEPLFFFPDTIFHKAGKGYGVKYRNISKKKGDKWGWDFGDAEKSSIVTSDSIVTHYYADTGVYNVTLQNMASGASVTMKVHVISSTEVEPLSVTLTPGQQAASVNDVYNFEKLTVYPNPVREELNVVLPETSDQLKIEIINLSGQTVKTIYAYGTKHVKLNVKDLPSGTYILRSTRKSKVGIARFIKQ